MPLHHTVSKSLRIAQVSCAIFWCLLAAGPAFGFAAFKPVLIGEGVYRSYCTPEEIDANVPVCSQQELKLNFVFTVAATTTNVAAVPIGFMLDWWGPKVCGILGSLFIFAACFILRSAYYITAFDGYIVGYALLALGGPYTFISSFQLSNTFPEYSGTILALITGAFDASSALFLFYRIAYEKTNGAFYPTKFFTWYLAVPTFILLCQLFLMPSTSYKMGELAKIAEEATEPHLVQRAEAEATEHTGLLPNGNASVPASDSAPQPITYDAIEPLGPDAKAQAVEDISGIAGVLHGYSAWYQIRTPWFYLMALFTLIQMLRINYFVATVLSQYTYLLGYKEAKVINAFFDIALPAGGALAIPFIGLLLDNFSTYVILIILTITTLTIGVFGWFPYAWTAYITITILVAYRPFYYTTVSDFCAKVFGFETFGTVYGLIICISGMFNLTQSVLDKTVHQEFGGNPTPINMILTGLTAAFSFALLIFVNKQLKKLSMKKLQEEAETATPSLMPGA